MSDTECNKCTVDPEQRCEEPNSLALLLLLMRENIIKEFAEQDFVRVRRCAKCKFYSEEVGTGLCWCMRYDETRFATDYCSEAVPKEK